MHYYYDYAINVRSWGENLSQHKSERPTSDQPNILILEIDSVSSALLERRLPRLQSLFNGRTDVCKAPLASNLSHGLFSLHNPVGANSLPNQLALLSGCVPMHLNSRWNEDENRRSEELLKAGWTRVQEHWPDGQKHFNCRIRGKRSSAWGASHYQLMCPPGINLPFRRPNFSGTPDTNVTRTFPKKSKRSNWLFDIAKVAGYQTSFAEDVCYHFSDRCGRRFSSQDLFYDTEAGFHHSRFSSMFCALPYLRGRAPRDITEVRLKQEMMLEYVKAFFAHSDDPKFQLVNIGIGHDYRYLPFRFSGMEQMDGIITEVLCNLLSNTSTANNTVVILYSDHGMQDGPGSLDWASQMEQRNPALGIIAPSTHTGTAFNENLNRLATPYDLHRTISTLLDPLGKVAVSHHPSWAYDLLGNIAIPEERTCASAVIPPDFCSCSHEYTGAVTLDSLNLTRPNFLRSKYSDAVRQSELTSKERTFTSRPECSTHEINFHGVCNQDDAKKLHSCCYGGAAPLF